MLPQVGQDDCDDRTSTPSRTTLWRRKRGKPSRSQSKLKQQYLSPREEDVLVGYVLQFAQRGYPLPVKALRMLAFEIARNRHSESTANRKLSPPGENWPQAFYKRHPELKSKRLKALDWTRHSINIHEKVKDWFNLIGRELQRPDIIAENVYNMDETGMMLSVLNSLKVLVKADSLCSHRGAGVKRTLVTTIECVSADGRCLDPLVIWPAVTHRSTWTTHPTPGWHFACSKKGYTNADISLYWIQSVFDPQTKVRAGDKPRILINDGFGTHESADVIRFCLENNIILCRLPSHASHKLQPCDVGVFGPLKTAYREQVEQLYRGGANSIGKQHFPLLYSRAREQAMTARNIRSGWAKAGLVPFNPSRVLKDLQPDTADTPIEPSLVEHQPSVQSPQTPVTFEHVIQIRVDENDDFKGHQGWSGQGGGSYVQVGV